MLRALARNAICHRNADFRPEVLGGRIGPQGVRVVTAKLQAQNSRKIGKIHVPNTKGKK